MIDTHAHLYDEQFDTDRNDVIHRAVESGVTCMLLPNIDEQTIRPMLALCQQYPAHCFSMIGLHPTSVKENFEQQLDNIKPYLNDRSVIAVGEIGIDLYWDKQYITQQIEAFRTQLQWAKQYHLPVSIHCRKSYNEIMSVLKAEQDGTLKGIFHCFPGNIRQAEEVTKLGFSLGIGGVVTYKNAEMAKVVEYINLEYIVTETDAPYLPPIPHRGKRNESAYISYIIQKISELKKMSPNEVDHITHMNALRIFGKIPQAGYSTSQGH